MFLDCKPHNFKGSEGPLDSFDGLRRLNQCLKCATALRRIGKYATGTLEGPALTWWNSNVQTLGWEEYCPRSGCRNWRRSIDISRWRVNIEEYTTRSHELARLLPHMATPASKWIERYIGIGASDPGIGHFFANPTTIQQVFA
ncbi:hypothetical protein R6Q59_012101 [Mikania micrantha]